MDITDVRVRIIPKDERKLKAVVSVIIDDEFAVHDIKVIEGAEGHFIVMPSRKTPEGKWLWPGYGDNSRVLKWIFDRCDNKDNYVDTAIGYMPKEGALNVEGLNVSAETMKAITSVDKEGWLKEIKDIRENHYPKFGKHLPKELLEQLDILEKNLKNM